MSDPEPGSAQQKILGFLAESDRIITEGAGPDGLPVLPVDLLLPPDPSPRIQEEQKLCTSETIHREADDGT